MGEPYDQVVAMLPRLTPEERARIAERLKMLGSASSPPAPGDEDLATAMVEVISEVVLRMSGERAAPAALRRTRGFSALREKARDLAPFLARAARARAERRALLSLGFELLYRDLRRGGFSVTARVLMACAHQVPGVLDQSFPGYARSGRLGMLIGGEVGLTAREEGE